MDAAGHRRVSDAARLRLRLSPIESDQRHPERGQHQEGEHGARPHVQGRVCQLRERERGRREALPLERHWRRDSFQLDPHSIAVLRRHRSPLLQVSGPGPVHVAAAG